MGLRDGNNNNNLGEDARSDLLPFNAPLFGLPMHANMFNSFFSSRSRGEWVPAVDIAERNDRYILIADLPEMTKEDLRVYTESASAVCIAGTRRRAELSGERVPMIVAERGVGRFERCFELPSKVDEAGVRASFKDSQLTVEIPKLQKSTRGGNSTITIE